jgi:hypothetical protein
VQDAPNRRLAGAADVAEDAGHVTDSVLLLATVMPVFMPGIHVFLAAKQDVDGRDKPGHDGVEVGK